MNNNVEEKVRKALSIVLNINRDKKMRRLRDKSWRKRKHIRNADIQLFLFIIIIFFLPFDD